MTLKAGLRALLIDDQEFFLTMLGRCLEELSVTPVTAKSGPEGLERLTEAQQSGKQYDVVFLDMYMPEVNGIETAKRMRASGFTGPIVAFTVHSTVEGRREAKSAGIGHYLSKATFSKELLRAIVTETCS
jgi:CheY-like chemotaxis protein